MRLVVDVMGFVDFMDVIGFMNFTLCGGSWRIVSYESDPASDPGGMMRLPVTPEYEPR